MAQPGRAPVSGGLAEPLAHQSALEAALQLPTGASSHKGSGPRGQASGSRQGPESDYSIPHRQRTGFDGCAGIPDVTSALQQCER